jgi:hypothetical protein
MPKGLIDYGRLVEQALRTVVRDVLGRLAREGLAPPHHFYITFRTGAPGVQIPDYLRERYPTEMTIVLQYQFWDLDVNEDGFGVTLSFNEVPQRLNIPYSAIKVFADPGAEFGLQFTIEQDASEVVALADRQPAHEHLTEARPAAEPATGDEDQEDRPEGGAEIVTLDSFRKK